MLFVRHLFGQLSETVHQNEFPKMGGYFPEISEECVECGLCRKVCPHNSLTDYDGTEKLEEYILGEYKSVFCAKNKDRELLKDAASGGVVTGIIRRLLDKGEYDSAFLVCGYNYNAPIMTKRFTAGDSLKGTTRSRYLTVSHENTVRYMLEHPDERIIIVGTGCAIQGFLNTINVQRKLHRENYLLIGLFCEKTMNYNVIRYFSQHKAGHGRTIKEFYFKHKAAGGWPGNVRIVYEDESVCDLPNTERMKVKDYFSCERCLYCLDKLNRNADISVGDNYIKKNADPEGVSSVIVRTEIGRRVWEICRDGFEYHVDAAEELLKAQVISSKAGNFEFAKIKGLYGENAVYDAESEKQYQRALKKIEIGKKDNSYAAVDADINLGKLKGKIKRVLGK